MENDMGKLLRDLRKKKRMTLKELSEKTGLSKGFLSQVEHSKSSVTLQSLSKISDALEVSRSYFFPDPEEQKSQLDKKNGQNHQINQANFVYQSLSSNIEAPLFEPMLVILFPNNYKKITTTHKGQEFVYVLEGTLTVVIEEEESELAAGGSFHIESSTPHTWFNNTDEVVKLLYVNAYPPE